MNTPTWSENYDALKKQAKVLYTLCKCNEKVIAIQSERIRELERKLSLVDVEEIEALRNTIELLTNELEKSGY